MLRTTLSSHPEIICHGEVLGRNRIMGFVRAPATPTGEALYRMRGESVRPFLESQVYASPAGAEVVGFKALYYHFGELKFAEAIDYLISSIDIKVIFLWRNDLVKRALSEAQHRMLATSKETPCEFSLPQIAQDCRNQLISVRWLKKVFSRHSCLELSYEDLIDDQQGRLDEICRFLGAMEGRIALPERNKAADDKSVGQLSKVIGHLRNIARSNAVSRSKDIPYPLVANANFLLEHQDLAQYRNIVPWA